MRTAPTVISASGFLDLDRPAVGVVCCAVTLLWNMMLLAVSYGSRHILGDFDTIRPESPPTQQLNGNVIENALRTINHYPYH